jgi:hypothetical protein
MYCLVEETFQWILDGVHLDNLLLEINALGCKIFPVPLQYLWISKKCMLLLNSYAPMLVVTCHDDRIFHILFIIIHGKISQQIDPF